MATTTPNPLPRLENGDHLTREEFENRYDADPCLKKAELIDGVVYLSSPVRHAYHGKQHFDTIGWLAHFKAATPGVEGGANSSLRLDPVSEPQTDAYLFLLPQCGGQARIDSEGYLVGAPELVAEVAVSCFSIDLHLKLQAYQRNGVKEYVVWRVWDQAIDWFVLRGNRFELLPVGEVYQSAVFPGLWLDHRALIGGDHAKVLQVLNQGISDPKHAAFVQKLLGYNREHDPEFIASIAEAREQVAQGRIMTHEELKKRLGIAPPSE